MTKRALDKIAEGLQEGIETTRADQEPGAAAGNPVSERNQRVGTISKTEMVASGAAGSKPDQELPHYPEPAHLTAAAAMAGRK